MNNLAGIVYPDVYQNTHQLSKMLSIIGHRVPKPTRSLQDIYTHKNIEIGVSGKKMARLHTDDLFVGVDGYILNHLELGEILKKKGYPHTNQHPDMVILHAYEEWGSQFLEYLEGDFSLFVYDKKAGTLLISRDRIGKKPLYWSEEQGHFLFCSSLKGILATGIVPQTTENDALAAYFHLGYFPQDMTPVQNINKLLPGHYLLLQKDGSKMISSYWSYSSYFEHPLQNHRNTISQKLDVLLNEATKKNIPLGAQTIGTLLTGGLGSSSIAYYLKNNAGDRAIEAFTAWYKKETEKDYEAAHEVSEILNIPQHSQVVTPQNFLDDLVAIVWYLEEPVADPNVIAFWKMAQSASKYTTNVFSGMGCDELLAGHSRYSMEEQQNTLFINLQNTLRQMMCRYIIPVVNKIYRPWAYDLLKHCRKNVWQNEYLRANALFSSTELEEISPALCDLFDPEVFLSKFHNLGHIVSPTSTYIYFDVKTSLPDLYILELERMTAAFALQWHTPFLDRKVIEFLASVPLEEQLPEKDTASFLKTIMNAVFPPSIVNRPKRRRPEFLKDWIENSELHLIFSDLTKGTLVEVGLVDDEWIKQAVKTPESRKENFHYLWSILTLEIWFKLFINNPIRNEPPNMSVRDFLLQGEL